MLIPNLLPRETTGEKQLDKLWAFRDFESLRDAGCVRNNRNEWELWVPSKEDPEARILVWTNKNKP